MQTALVKIKNWLETYPGHKILEDFSVDYTDKIPGNGGIFPNGLVENARTVDILGHVKTQNQLNFGIFYVFQKAPGDDAGAEFNAEWVSDFQAWVQEQSCRRLAPVFGDEPWSEQITAQNGTMYSTDAEGTAMYMVQLSATYTKCYN